MEINIYNVRPPKSASPEDAESEKPSKNSKKENCIFFTVGLRDKATDELIIIDNFKIVGDRLYPPQRHGNNWYYDTVAISPKLAYRIAEAYRAQIRHDLPIDAGKTLMWAVQGILKLFDKSEVKKALDIYTLHLDEEDNPYVRL